ncbi:caspase family protein [Bernardetia sp.]|uniref:caspase family protein n=1 Tax=Bernardetia sp. TaxID=1937974 RepID=UPI0025BCDA17|nr:caspase family protein [Bernardetia sp.]
MKHVTVSFFVLLILFSFTSKPQQNNQEKFILIQCGATSDPNEDIRKGVQKNMDGMEELMKKIATILNRDFENIELTGNNFNDQTLKKQLTTLENKYEGQKPIIVFYYVGHGEADKEVETELPYLLFKTRRDANNNLISLNPNGSIYLGTISNQIEASFPYSTRWVIAETCNQFLKNSQIHNYSSGVSVNAGTQSQLLKQNMTDVFKESLTIYSSKRGEPAYITKDGGVFFAWFDEIFTDLIDNPEELTLNNLKRKLIKKQRTRFDYQGKEVMQTLGFGK